MSEAYLTVNSENSEKVIPVTVSRWRKINWSAYLFLLPAFLLFAVFVVYPVIFNFTLSFHDWNGMRPVWEAVGFKHYERLFSDRLILLSLRNSGVFLVGHLFTMGFALVLAVLFNNPIPGRNLARTLIFIPFVLSTTIIAVTWKAIYEANNGPLNVMLRGIGLGALAHDWLGDPQSAIWAITFMGVWAGLGFPMVVYLASLQSIEHDINDAARVDGANRFQVFRLITFPLLRNTHLILFMLGVIGAVQAFDGPFVMTRGGPFYATTTLTIQVYKNMFDFGDFGYGAAIAQFTMLLLVLLILFQRYFLREREGN